MLDWIHRIVARSQKVRALNHYVKGEFAEARALLLRVEQRAPDEPGLDYNLGLVEFGLGRLDSAEERLSRAARGDSGDAARRALADLYYVSGQREKALQAYRGLMTRLPPGPQRRLVEERIAVCRSESAFAKVPRSYRLLDEGAAALRGGDVEAAHAAFEQAVVCDPTNYAALNNLGSVLLNHRAASREALSHFERAAEVWDSPVVKANLAHCRAAGSE